MKKHFLILICIIGIVACNNNEHLENLVFNNPFLIEEDGRPLVIAHRGGTKFFPENTLLAFQYSEDIGVDVLELDIHLTADSQIVVCHDKTIDRTSDSSGEIRYMDYQTLSTFNFGYHFIDENGDYPYRNDAVKIPLLEEVFQQFPNSKMIIEIKSEGYNGKRTAAELLDLIESYNMQDKVASFSFDHQIMDFYHRNNDLPSYTGASILDVLDFAIQANNNNNDIIKARYDIMALPLELEGIPLNTDKKTLFEIAHKSGISICYWTINDTETMKDLILKGADGIITNRPDKLIEVLIELGF